MWIVRGCIFVTNVFVGLKPFVDKALGSSHAIQRLQHQLRIYLSADLGPLNVGKLKPTRRDGKKVGFTMNLSIVCPILTRIPLTHKKASSATPRRMSLVCHPDRY